MKTSHKFVGNQVGPDIQRGIDYEQAIDNLGDPDLVDQIVLRGLRIVRYGNTRLPIPPGPNQLRDTAIGVLLEELRRARNLLPDKDVAWGTWGDSLND